MKAAVILTLIATIAVTYAAEPRSVYVSTSVDTDNYMILSLPSVTIKEGKMAIVSETKPYYFPTRFDKPEKVRSIKNEDSQFGHAWIPMFPTEFTQSENGWKFQYTTTVEKGVICLVGMATYTRVNLDSTVYGEYTGPIYETINGKKYLACQNIARTAAVDTTQTYFQIFAKPGQKYTVKLKQGDHWTTASIACGFDEKSVRQEFQMQGKRLTLNQPER